MKNPENYPSLPELEDALAEDGNIGFCLACGAQSSGVEPDGRRYRCETCGAHEVYGAEECLALGAFNYV